MLQVQTIGRDLRCDQQLLLWEEVPSPLAQPRHDKEGVRERALMQIGLGVGLNEGLPVFNKVFDGNISDSRTLHDLITAFRSYGRRLGSILFDGGISLARNVERMADLGWHTIGGLPMTPPMQE
jgi:hypothetical protein